MKNTYKAIALVLFAVLFLLPLSALEGEIVFVLGTVDFRTAGGPLEFADFGMTVREGDSIITGFDGEAQLSLPNGSSVNISPDTVFTFRSAVLSPGGEPENVFDVVRGRVAFKFNRLGDEEPNIRARSALAGIRGTEFTVIAANDGQSLFVVSEGAVEVSVGGRAVSLGVDEAVEVSLSGGVGEKYPVLQGNIDFEDWRNSADANALADPAGTLGDMTDLMLEYLEAAEAFRAESQSSASRQRELIDEISALRAEGKDADADALVEGEYRQVQRSASSSALNYRYYALSIQSLRRFVVAGLYVAARNTELTDGNKNPDFAQQYRRFREIYEDRAVSFFVPADI